MSGLRPLVVCVDDDATILSAVARCLRREQLEVRATRSASDALAQIAQHDVAVLVSDYDMPDMTGAQLAGAARRMRPETVRILLTGMRTLETAIDGINQGEIFRFLPKPFDHEALRAAVLGAVARHRELVALSGDRERHERRAALTAALESEFPGISNVARIVGEPHELPIDPWSEAAALGLPGLCKALES